MKEYHQCIEEGESYERIGKEIESETKFQTIMISSYIKCNKIEMAKKIIENNTSPECSYWKAKICGI